MVTAVLSHYVDSIRDNLRLDTSSEREVLNELETHIEDEFRELREAGLSEEDAANTCIKFLGSAKLVARQIYEAHSQGTWRQVLFAAMPHLLFTLLFALNWWQGIGWLVVMLTAVVSMVAYGWWHGKPTWLFPWLGYALVPVVAAGLLLLYLPKEWSWLAILLYIPLALWLLYSITVQTIRKDWLYSSLMLLPLPTTIGWFLAVGSADELSGYWLERIHHFAPWIGLNFFAFAIAVAMFIRFRQRWLKAAVLLITGLLTLTLVACYAWGWLGLPTLLVLILVTLSLFLIPAFLEHKIRHSRHEIKKEAQSEC